MGSRKDIPVGFLISSPNMMIGSAAALPNHFLHTSDILVDISSIILFKNKEK